MRDSTQNPSIPEVVSWVPRIQLKVSVANCSRIMAEHCGSIRIVAYPSMFPNLVCISDAPSYYRSWNQPQGSAPHHTLAHCISERMYKSSCGEPHHDPEFDNRLRLKSSKVGGFQIGFERRCYLARQISSQQSCIYTQALCERRAL